MTLDEVFNAEELVKYADTLMKDDNPALWESLFPSEIAPSLILPSYCLQFDKLLQNF